MAPEAEQVTPGLERCRPGGIRVAIDAEQPIRDGILDAIERARGRPLTEIDIALYDAVEPRAIEHLTANTRGPPRVSFQYDGYTITVRRTDASTTVSVLP